MSRNDITNDIIASGPDGTEAQDKYAKGWDAIFGKKKETEFSESQQAILDDDEPCVMGGGCYNPFPSYPDGKCMSQGEDMRRVQEWLEKTRSEFAEQVKKAMATLPEGWEGGVMAGPVHES